MVKSNSNKALYTALRNEKAYQLRLIYKKIIKSLLVASIYLLAGITYLVLLALLAGQK